MVAVAIVKGCNRSLWPTVSMKLHPLLRFVFSVWGSRPSLTLGAASISDFVKIHWDRGDEGNGRTYCLD